MKKFLIALVLVIGCVLLFGCEKTEDVDYSEFPFTDVSWERDAQQDIETIFFGADGRFTYYCSCGNPVNDSDLCEGYTYDNETKTITLNCIETTDEMVTKIKIIKCDGNELCLDFDGETRIFYK